MTAGKVPESVRRAIADPLVLGDQASARWQPPADLPKVDDVRAALAVLRADLEPAKPKDARWCLGKIARPFGATLDGEAWMAAHGKMPLDLWRKATLAALQRDQAPTVETFAESVSAILQRRRTDLARAEAILARLTAPKPMAAFRPDPPAVRLGVLMRSAQQRGDITTAARYERELAQLEQREPAAWALGPDEPSLGPNPAPPTVEPIRPTAASQAMMLRARARYWRGLGITGLADRLAAEADAVMPRVPVYQHDDEPPPPDAVLEAEHGDATA